METITLRPHPIYALAKTLPILILGVLISMLGYCLHPLFIIPAILVCLYGWYRYFYIRAVKFELNTNTLQMTSGLFNKRIDSLELFRIKDYVITQSFFMRIAGLMNMTLISTDMTNKALMMSGIPFAPELTDHFRDVVRAARQINKILELS